MGVLSLVPKDAQGQPITDYSTCIVYDKNGNELKEWYALAAYLENFGDQGIHEWYAFSGNGSKLVSSSMSPVVLFTNLNGISYAAMGLVLALILLVLLIVRCILRRRKKKRAV